MVPEKGCRGSALSCSQSESENCAAGVWKAVLRGDSELLSLPLSLLLELGGSNLTPGRAERCAVGGADCCPTARCALLIAASLMASKSPQSVRGAEDGEITAPSLLVAILRLML